MDKKTVTQRMAEINKKGFIAISNGMYRNYDGILHCHADLPDTLWQKQAH